MELKKVKIICADCGADLRDAIIWNRRPPQCTCGNWKEEREKERTDVQRLN